MRLLFQLLACTIAILLLASPVFTAGGVSVIKTKESGTGTAHLSADITYWCGQNLFTVGVKDAGSPLSGVSVYLFYGDYSYQLLATNTTDGSGNARLQIVGNEALLKNMFVVRLEKSGYKTSETELRINCAPGAQPPSNQSGASGNITQNSSGSNSTAQGSSSQNNQSSNSSQQGTNNSSGQPNQTGQNNFQNSGNLPAQLPQNQPKSCIGAALILAGLGSILALREANCA